MFVSTPSLLTNSCISLYVGKAFNETTIFVSTASLQTFSTHLKAS